MEAEDREAQDRESRLSRIGIFILRGLFGLFMLSIALFFVLYSLPITPNGVKNFGLVGFLIVNIFFCIFPIKPPFFWKIIVRSFLATVCLFVLIDGIWIGAGGKSFERFVEGWTESQSLGYSLGAFLMIFFLEFLALLVLVPLRRPEKTSDEKYWL
jgi:hypothetical protein